MLYCAPLHTRTPQHSTAPCCPLLYWAVSWGARETRRLTGRMAGSYWGQSHSFKGKWMKTIVMLQMLMSQQLFSDQYLYLAPPNQCRIVEF